MTEASSEDKSIVKLNQVTSRYLQTRPSPSKLSQSILASQKYYSKAVDYLKIKQEKLSSLSNKISDGLKAKFELQQEKIKLVETEQDKWLDYNKKNISRKKEQGNSIITASKNSQFYKLDYNRRAEKNKLELIAKRREAMSNQKQMEHLNDQIKKSSIKLKSQYIKECKLKEVEETKSKDILEKFKQTTGDNFMKVLRKKNTNGKDWQLSTLKSSNSNI